MTLDTRLMEDVPLTQLNEWFKEQPAYQQGYKDGYKGAQNHD